MTAGADTQYLVVIDRVVRYRSPRRWTRQVTRIAHISSVNVTRAFTRGNRAIMATGTGSNHLRMIYGTRLHRRPGCWKYGVAGITLVTAINMVSILTTGRYTVVTIHAVIHKA